MERCCLRHCSIFLPKLLCIPHEKRKRNIDISHLKWYNTKRCRKQKPSVSHLPPFVVVGRSDMKITRRVVCAAIYFALSTGGGHPFFYLGNFDGGDNDQQGIACERTDSLP